MPCTFDRHILKPLIQVGNKTLQCVGLRTCGNPPYATFQVLSGDCLISFFVMYLSFHSDSWISLIHGPELIPLCFVKQSLTRLGQVAMDFFFLYETLTFVKFHWPWELLDPLVYWSSFSAPSEKLPLLCPGTSHILCCSIKLFPEAFSPPYNNKNLHFQQVSFGFASGKKNKYYPYLADCHTASFAVPAVWNWLVSPETQIYSLFGSFSGELASLYVSWNCFN